jgi:hypothetical protein
VPPRHLKSLMNSIAFPAWCLGHHPSAQILCVSYAQDLADKLARDCRGIMMSPWYRQIFPTRLAPHRQAGQEFITTRQGYRLATATGESRANLTSSPSPGHYCWPRHRLASGREARARLVTPKNRGPDQCAPVIRSAITVSER